MRGKCGPLTVDEPRARLPVMVVLSPRLSSKLPSKRLIFLVNGHRDKDAYDASRHAVVPNMINLLDEAGVDYRVFRNVLDFGCGCGRVLAGWEHYRSNIQNLHGVDINRTLVAFSQKHIPYAIVDRSTYYPPLPFKDAYFDFIYAGSVWTHLNREAAEGWAREAIRMLALGGVLMMSFHGSYYLPELRRISNDGGQNLIRHGFYMFRHGGPVHDGHNNYATFMTADYVMGSLFRDLDTVMHFPGDTRGPNPFASYQDIVVLRKSV
jgi:SAM-dependent methyltransferase